MFEKLKAAIKSYQYAWWHALVQRVIEMWCDREGIPIGRHFDFDTRYPVLNYSLINGIAEVTIKNGKRMVTLRYLMSGTPSLLYWSGVASYQKRLEKMDMNRAMDQAFAVLESVSFEGFERVGYDISTQTAEA